MAAADPKQGRDDWWRRHAFGFSLALLATFALLVGIGWMTGLRHVMHGALLSVAAVALLPFLVVAAGVLICVVGLCSSLVLAAFFGEDTSEIAFGAADAGELALEGTRWLPRYYAFIRGIRHPTWWGGLCGLLLGGLFLSGLVATLVVPGERHTIYQLQQGKFLIEQAYEQQGAYPKRVAGPAYDTLADAAGRVLEDGFGRPFRYSTQGAWKFVSYELRSLGFDGEVSADDLCVRGGTRAMEIAQLAKSALKWVHRGRAEGVSLGDELSVIGELQCGD
jgi:hypothetical protein